MENQSALFVSVFSRLIESFAPVFHVVVNNFEEKFEQKNGKITIEDLFDTFPHNLTLYQTSIKSLSELANCNLSLFIQQIIEMFQNALQKGELSIFNLLLTSTPTYFQPNSQASSICLQFALFTTTDILGQIVRHYGIADQGMIVSKCAYRICDNSIKVPIHKYLLREWSIILSVTSLHNFGDASSPFSMYVNEENNEMIFTLVSRLRLDSCIDYGSMFLDDIYNTLKNLYRKKLLTSHIFHCVASLVSSVNFFSETMQKIFDIAWSEREDSKLKNGALDLIVTLFPHLPGSELKAASFFKHRVYAHAGNDKKTKRSLQLFWKKLIGGYSGFSLDDNFSFITTCCDDAASLLPVFMDVFFKKSNFALAPKMFCDVLIHLASINFTYFLKEMLPSFLLLPITDSRFIVLLSAIKPLNSDSFMIKACSDISKQDIEALDAMVRGKVCQNLSILEKHDKDVFVTQLASNNIRQIDQFDQKVAHFLEMTLIDKFGQLNIKMKEPTSKDVFSPIVPLLEALTFILDDSDFLQQGIINTIVALCGSSDLDVSNAARRLENFISCREALQLPLLKTLLNFLSDVQSQESMYNSIYMLLSLVQRDPKCLTEDILYDIETTAFIGLISTQPIIRSLSYNLLNVVDEKLERDGFYSILQPNISLMEGYVKQRLLGKNITNEPLLFTWALSSHFYDIWLLFMTEVLDILIASNYTPLLIRFNDTLSEHIITINNPNYNIEPESIGVAMLFFAAHANYEVYQTTTQIYKPHLFDERQLDLFENKDPHICCRLISELLKNDKSWQDQFAFNLIQHINLSLAGEIADIFTSCLQNEIPDASSALLVLIDSPASNDMFIETIRKPCLSFLAVVNTYLLKVGANSPRIVKWTPELERNVIKSLTAAENYCTLIEKIIPRSITEVDWSVSSRELVLRCLLNWARTESPVLETLRAKTKTALAHLAKAGPMFNDSLLFDESCCNTFALIEASGNRVLQSLLFYHVQQLLVQFCEASLTYTRLYADLFFDALFVVFTAGSDFAPQEVGCLLLVGVVYTEMQHPRAKEFMEAFQSSVFDGFGEAAETVFSEAFRIMQTKSTHLPAKEIIASLRKFVKEIRILPKQTVCNVDAPTKFHVYTPYQFLVALMETTESINDDYFVSMALLWRDLLNNSDHADIVPLFIMQWKNSASKKRLLIALIKQDAPFILEKLVSRCSFTYFVHIAEQNKDFKEELWVIEIITAAFERRSGSITNVAALIHFAFLFYERPETQTLLNALCRQFEVQPPKTYHKDDIIATVAAFVRKLYDECQDILDKWGTEALKWLFGSEDYNICSISLKIYNLIGKPSNKIVTNGVLKVVSFLVEKNESDVSKLTDLISESFRFFYQAFDDDEMLAFNYASAFLDCPDFTDDCRAVSTDIFLKSLNSQATNKFAWESLPSIIRPLLSSIENDSRSRQILDILIKSSNSEELMMIAAPLREVCGGYSNCKPTTALIDKASQTTLCKAIEHYALMIETASEQLAEAIFSIASILVQKAANENVRDSLSRLYKAALNMLGVCPSAMKFVISIAEHDPGTATKSIFAFVDWARTIDDVKRALNRLVKPSAPVTTLSDTSPLASFEAIIGSDYLPKILPFATQQEIIEGMMRVQPTKHRRRGFSIRRADSTEMKRNDTILTVNWELKPLNPPQQLCGKLNLSTEYGSLILSETDFDAAY